MVTLSLSGKLRSNFHFDTSGNSSVRILIVFRVAVAVIRTNFPSMPESSPVERAIAGRNALPDFAFRPQLTTGKKSVQQIPGVGPEKIFGPETFYIGSHISQLEF